MRNLNTTADRTGFDELSCCGRIAECVLSPTNPPLCRPLFAELPDSPSRPEAEPLVCGLDEA